MNNKKESKKNTKIKDIKDYSPNKKIIEHLETLLDYAKKGELRSYIALYAWDDDSLTHSWCLDYRNKPRAMVGEFMFLMHDFIVDTEIREGQSILFKNIF
jgi:hypothetical protein